MHICFAIIFKSRRNGLVFNSFKFFSSSCSLVYFLNDFVLVLTHSQWIASRFFAVINTYAASERHALKFVGYFVVFFTQIHSINSHKCTDFLHSGGVSVCLSVGG